MDLKIRGYATWQVTRLHLSFNVSHSERIVNTTKWLSINLPLANQQVPSRLKLMRESRLASSKQTATVALGSRLNCAAVEVERPTHRWRARRLRSGENLRCYFRPTVLSLHRRLLPRPTQRCRDSVKAHAHCKLPKKRKTVIHKITIAAESAIPSALCGLLEVHPPPRIHGCCILEVYRTLEKIIVVAQCLSS